MQLIIMDKLTRTWTRSAITRSGMKASFYNGNAHGDAQSAASDYFQL
jgi:hypothetical protein